LTGIDATSVQIGGTHRAVRTRPHWGPGVWRRRGAPYLPPGCQV